MSADMFPYFLQLIQVVSDLREDVRRLNAFRGAIESGVPVANEQSMADRIESYIASTTIDAGILAIVGEVVCRPEAVILFHLR